jgi:hypothetical protein
MSRRAATVQGAYYVLSGPTPFLSRRGFEALTGPKADWWLVNTVGGLVTVVGATLASAAARDAVTPETRLLGMGAAAVLAGIDVTYVVRRRIPPVYLADAAIQAGCLVLWARDSVTDAQ